MNIADVIALVIFVGIIAYAVFGGADFGSGFWDLTAGGSRRGSPMRTLIDHSIGPVWEANHVWLIFVLVFLWTGFPAPYAALMRTLIVPLMLAGLGIVLRGSAFAFRKSAPTLAQARVYGVTFAVSSVVTPFFLGAVAGAVASGDVPLEGSGDRWSSWTGPTALVGGVLAVLTCAFLAAAFLAAEADKLGQTELREKLRRRALGSGFASGVVALVAVVPIRNDARDLFDGLTGPAAPVVVLSAVAGGTALYLLWNERLRPARVAAVGAVATVVAGWGVAQYPNILGDEAPIDETAGANATLWGLLIAFGLVAVMVIPALIWMLSLTERGVFTESKQPAETE